MTDFSPRLSRNLAKLPPYLFARIDALKAEAKATGADLIDVGGDSTGPGADPVEEGEEIARVVPVIAALRAASQAPISIDTMKPGVALAAMAAGANIWNDVAALRGPGALETAAALQRRLGEKLIEQTAREREWEQDARARRRKIRPPAALPSSSATAG